MYSRTIRMMSNSEREDISRLLRPAPPAENQSLCARTWRYLSGGSYWTRVVEDYKKRMMPNYRAILDDNHVIVDHVVASGVVEFEEMEDEGPTYVFEVGKGQLYCLYGQNSYPSNENDVAWPNTEFEVIRSREHPHLYQRIWCRGSALDPRRFVKRSDVRYELLPHAEAFDGSLDSLEHQCQQLSERLLP